MLALLLVLVGGVLLPVPLYLGAAAEATAPTPVWKDGTLYAVARWRNWGA